MFRRARGAEMYCQPFPLCKPEDWPMTRLSSAASATTLSLPSVLRAEALYAENIGNRQPERAVSGG
jgi:hypothetical protein